ncbi:MAG: M48 family metallopeptidase, partial [Treponema sp.]|nr:M48 family metallopeptidase [Treponema sp.]
MDFGFELDSIVFEVEYRNVKTMRLTVYPPDGRVVIAAPCGTEPAIIKKFASSKIPWIEKHRERFLNHSKITGSLKNHSTVYIWGESHELLLAEHQGNTKITVKDGSLIMSVRPGTSKAKKQEYLDRWYRRLVKNSAPPIIEKWEIIMGIKIQKLYIRKMKSHWGSCNCARQTLRLNSELAKRKIECLEYVIVHEMLHIFEKGHNRNFYRLLNQYLPAWKEI